MVILSHMRRDTGRKLIRAEIALTLVLIAACGQTKKGSSPSVTREGGTTDAYPPEQRDITITLWPIYDVDEVVAATPTSLPKSLDGVHVCVDRARPHQGSWDDFRKTDGPCTESQTGMPIVLEGAPPRSELIVTAAKDGYWPSAFAVVTGDWSLDVTTSPPTTRLRLLAKGSSWPGMDPPPDDNLGLVSIVAQGCVFTICAPLGGASVSLEPAAGRGPFYSDGTIIDDTATATLLQASESGNPSTPGALDWASARPEPLTLFADAEEGEYVAHFDHPLANCGIDGWYWGNDIWGYPGAVDEIRIPVLAGYFTPAISALCGCTGDDLLSLDPATCASALSADGGREGGLP